MVGEQPQQLRRLGVGGQLVHRVGAKPSLCSSQKRWACSNTQATSPTGIA
jgi:hypothetical protein